MWPTLIQEKISYWLWRMNTNELINQYHQTWIYQESKNKNTCYCNHCRDLGLCLKLTIEQSEKHKTPGWVWRGPFYNYRNLREIYNTNWIDYPDKIRKLRKNVQFYIDKKHPEEKWTLKTPYTVPSNYLFTSGFESLTGYYPSDDEFSEDEAEDSYG